MLRHGEHDERGDKNGDSKARQNTFYLGRLGALKFIGMRALCMSRDRER